MKFKTTQYANPLEILKYPTHHVGIPVMVNDAGVQADAEGRKIVPAGSLVGNAGTGPVAVTNGEQTKGVLLSDVDVTYGSVAGTMIVHGFININKIPFQPTDEAKAALPMVMFL